MSPLAIIAAVPMAGSGILFFALALLTLDALMEDNWFPLASFALGVACLIGVWFLLPVHVTFSWGT